MRWTNKLRVLPMVILLAGPTHAGDRVLVLCNGTEPDSVALARHYTAVRETGEEAILNLDCPATEVIAREEFEKTVREPVAHWLVEHGGAAEASTAASVVLVIIRGVPLRVEGSLGTFGRRNRDQHRDNDAASVDSELAALALPGPPVTKGSVVNPAYGREAMRPRIQVGRLDGPDWKTAQGLVDDAVAVEQAGPPRGRALIDHAALAARMGEEYERGDQWLTTLERDFAQAGFSVLADREPGLIATDADAGEPFFFYAGWYGPHVSGLLKRDDFTFQRGAVACHIHSLSAQTVRAPSQRWAGPLIARGAAVVLGNVDEPFLSHSTHLDVFFARLLAGDSAGEAMWKATPRLSWMNVMIGDPMYRPFGKDGD